jgi:hypothetical protein
MRYGWGRRPWKEFGTSLALGQAAMVPTMVAAILSLAVTGGSLYWQATGTVLCLLAGIADAWVLLVEILR